MPPENLNIEALREELRRLEIKRGVSAALAAQALDAFELTRDFRFLNSALKIMDGPADAERADKILEEAPLP